MGKGIGAFILGGLIGAGIALLYAPRLGVETRAIVSEKIGDTWGQAQEFGAQASASAQQFYQEATIKSQEAASTVAERSQRMYETASSKVQEAASTVKPVFTEKNDELREKIEAARARIANQVAKNAEETQNAIKDQITMVASSNDATGKSSKDVLSSTFDKLEERVADAKDAVADTTAKHAVADATKAAKDGVENSGE